MLSQLTAAFVLLAQPAGDAPVVQRPGQKQPEPPAEPPVRHEAPTEPEASTPPSQPQVQAPTTAPTNPPVANTPAVVPLGEPDPEPEPAPPPEPSPVAAEPVSVPGPPPNRPHVDPDPVEKPRGPGTVMIAVGSVLAAAGLSFTSAALISDRFAPRAWQRAVIVPLSLGALSGGSAVLILGIRRHVMTKRWEQSASARLLFSPTLGGGGSVQIVGRF